MGCSLHKRADGNESPNLRRPIPEDAFALCASDIMDTLNPSAEQWKYQRRDVEGSGRRLTAPPINPSTTTALPRLLV